MHAEAPTRRTAGQAKGAVNRALDAIAQVVLITLLAALPGLTMATTPAILPLQERADLIDRITRERIETVLPALMNEHDIDLWLIISREYNEDPVIRTLLPSRWMSARRRTILAIHRNDDGSLDTRAVARYDVGEVFRQSWDPEQQPDQWQRLVELIEEWQPDTIGINQSDTYGLADGLVATDLNELKAALGPRLSRNLVSAEPLALGWLQTRSATEQSLYPHIVSIAHNILAEAFSDAVITPGVTRTDDVRWWLRERIATLKLDTWFHPSVSLQRSDATAFDHLSTFTKQANEQIIQPGDLLHVDFGITYLRLNTDTQQHAYVLRACEQDAPEALKQALATANRLQDLLTGSFETGRSGNAVLLAARQKAEAEGITASIYSHPIGFHGHGAGPAIGMWDNQTGTLANGEAVLIPHSAFSIELNASTAIADWGKDVRIMLEEDAYFDGESVRYLAGRQTRFHLINAMDNDRLGSACMP